MFVVVAITSLSFPTNFPNLNLSASRLQKVATGNGVKEQCTYSRKIKIIKSLIRLLVFICRVHT